VEGFADFGLPGAIGEAVIDSLEADLLVEATPTSLTTGEPGLRHMRAALRRGLHVVAAHKAPWYCATPSCRPYLENYLTRS
jgi:homoserine dehydrogenase